ncbi:dephospho-CoA kinase [Pseudolysinimonas sp.]|jgi:dephospho-CoA kinase|uniref:dephospho-CoA kinase n=1 Tax=Pseudolysinimonas sp. TaxID=2680009 RepID=UPI003783DFD1
MLLVALTGGIASGKSTVARRLVEHGAVIVDADEVARDVVAPGEPALARIAEAFGPEVIAADGSLDRPALGAIVFRDPEGRQRLNAITHPAVLERSRALFAAAAAADPDAIVVYDIPLLVEAGRHDEFDLVVVVHAATETRIARMVELRGMTREEALHRLNSQATDTDRFAIADVVIDADGSLDETLAQADALWENLRARVGGAA